MTPILLTKPSSTAWITTCSFRAVATRLLQHYGYLLPGINPNSALGKQQELVLKERARRLVQIEAQEDAESLKQPHNDDEVQQTAQHENKCNPSQEQDCEQSLSRRPRQGNGLSVNPNRPGFDSDAVPVQNEPSSSSPLLRARGNLSADESASLNQSSSTETMRLATFSGSRELNTSRVSPADAERLAESLQGHATSADLNTPRNADGSRVPSNYTRANSSFENSGLPTNPTNFNFDKSQNPFVHKQNPYADVPSLYDLYVQVPGRDSTPQRFGVNILSGGRRESSAIPMDLPVGPDYIVGPGDSLAIDLWGGISQRMTRVVDCEGRISLPEAGPLLVSGRSLGDIQLTVQQVLRSQYRDASADVSLSRLRTIRVYVVGEVGDPGAYDISSLSTALNALIAAGGVTQRGSLRSLKHYRGKQLLEVVDAYDLLLRGVGTDEKRLETGDSLLVPPVGPQITIEGMVRRPAVYELHGETNLEDALELAGGILPAAALEHVEVERLVAHQKRTMFTVDLSQADNPSAAIAKLSTFHVQDGDRIHIFPIAPYSDQAIYLQGHVLRPGRYSFQSGMTFSDLIKSYADLLPEPAGSYAEIIRLNPPDFRPTVESFDLAAALANSAAAPKLMPLDTVRIFSKFEFQAVPDVWVGGEVRDPGPYTTSGQVRLRDAIYLAGGVSQNAELDSAQLFRTSKDGTLRILSVNLSLALAGNPTDNLILEPHDRIIVHRNPVKVDPPTVYVKGEVAKPGRYPLSSNMRVEDLIRISGGLKHSADAQNAVLTHQEEPPGNVSPSSTSINLPAAMKGDTTANKELSNGDVLTIPQVAGWNNLGARVTIRGEVENPGTYGITPGESLATVLAKAGGFTAEAYPYGTVLTRRDVRDLELKSHDELVARVKAEAQQLKALPENDAEQKNAKLTAIAQTETTLTQLQTNLPIGRVVVHGITGSKVFSKSRGGILHFAMAIPSSSRKKPTTWLSPARSSVPPLLASSPAEVPSGISDKLAA